MTFLALCCASFSLLLSSKGEKMTFGREEILGTFVWTLDFSKTVQFLLNFVFIKTFIFWLVGKRPGETFTTRYLEPRGSKEVCGWANGHSLAPLKSSAANGLLFGAPWKCVVAEHCHLSTGAGVDLGVGQFWNLWLPIPEQNLHWAFVVSHRTPQDRTMGTHVKQVHLAVVFFLCQSKCEGPSQWGW